MKISRHIVLVTTDWQDLLKESLFEDVPGYLFFNLCIDIEID